MALDYSNGLAAAVLDGGIGPSFDGTSGTVRMRIYSAAPTAVALSGRTARGNAAWPNDSTELGELTLNPTGTDVFSAAAISGAVMAALNGQDPTDVSAALNSGTAAWFVVYRTGDTAITSVAVAADRRLVGTVGTSGADLTINNTAVSANGTISMASAAWGFQL